MARKPKQPKQPERDPAAEARAARATEIRDMAMLLYSPEDAAQQLEMSVEEFTRLIEDPVYGDAWANGRLRVRGSLYKNLLAAANEGAVAAIRLALKMTENNPAPSGDDVESDSDDELVDRPLRIAPGSSLESRFREAMQRERRADGGAA